MTASNSILLEPPYVFKTLYYQPIWDWVHDWTTPVDVHRAVFAFPDKSFEVGLVVSFMDYREACLFRLTWPDRIL